MEHKSTTTDRHSDAIQSCSVTCQFTNLIEEQRPDQLDFLKSSDSKALQIRLMDWQNGIEEWILSISNSQFEYVKHVIG